LLTNEILGDIHKPTFVTSGQMFGSGKTELGRNATSILAHEDYKKERESLERRFTKEAVENYINAIRIRVDVRNLRKKESLDKSLAFLLAESITSVLGEIEKELETFEDVRDVVQFFR